MKLLLLGTSGLIGQDFLRFNSMFQFFKMETISREFRWPDPAFKTAILNADVDIIINAVSCNEFDHADKMHSIHYELPLWLAEHTNCKIILFSSDIVGQLEKGNLTDERYHHYAQAKMEMEKKMKSKPNVLVIRTSIVGLAPTSSNLLYKLFWNNPSKDIYANANAYWSGITTLQLFKVVQKVLNQSWQSGIIKAGSERVSFFELFEKIKTIFSFEKNIHRRFLPMADDRSFSSDLVLPSLTDQLIALRNLTG